jgi:flagellar L-ring protein FlgH
MARGCKVEMGLEDTSIALGRARTAIRDPRKFRVQYPLLCGLLCVLMGCATPPSEPDYSATWPESAPSATAANGAIYQEGHDIALFENSVARRVGDTLTIRLNESTNASKSSSTSTSKSTSAELGGVTIAGQPITHNGVDLLAAGVNNEAKFDGEGGSSQSNRLQGAITVTVAQRLPNGNLLIRGQKWISINQGKEYVRVQGIVRPIDIDPDNSISSLKVADAMIGYGASGALADANTPGLLSRFFNFGWLPF